MPPHLYIFTGLGADESVFINLDFTSYSVTFIQWEKQIGLSLKEYATLHIAQIKEPNPILIGLSFGGIIAVEIAKQMTVKKVIIISSVKNTNEIPFYFKWIGKIGIVKYLPNYFLKSSNSIANWLFGINTQEEKQLFKTILKNYNPQYLKWAIQKIMLWQNKTAIANITHIHGTKDRILPYKNVNSNYTIKNGGHFMVFNCSNEVMQILHSEIK